MANLETYYLELVAGKRRGIFDRSLLLLLGGCSFIYALLMRARSFAYAMRLLHVRRLGRPVISVGNIMAGGTGKTPTVAWLASYFMARGKRVAVLSRGYGGTLAGAIRIVSDGEALFATPEEAGDEPVLLARSLPGLLVVVGADRYRAGLLAQERLAPDIFIVDDGFQHLRLHRDLNILLLDCRRPFGNGRTFPAGLLREPKGASNRADLILLTRCKPAAALPQLTGIEKPVCRTSHHLAGFTSLDGGAQHPFSELKGLRGLAFAGIAAPADFFDTLGEEGVALVATLAFSDHICYGEEEIAALCRLKTASRAAYLITTGKDAVKLLPYRERLGGVYVAGLELSIPDVKVLEECLEKLPC
jgi:tetraacyldisaccharide 4'-kinase